MKNATQMMGTNPTETRNGAESGSRRWVFVVALVVPVFLLATVLYYRFMTPSMNFDIVSATQSWGALKTNQSVAGNPISILGKRFKSGLGTHAQSKITIVPKGIHYNFSGFAGVDDETKKAGSVVFKVSVNEKILFESPLMHGGDTPVQFNVAVDGASKVDLIVTDGGDGITADHADWANLHFN